FEAVAQFSAEVGDDQAVIVAPARHGEDLAVDELMAFARVALQAQVVVNGVSRLFNRWAHRFIITRPPLASGKARPRIPGSARGIREGRSRNARTGCGRGDSGAAA